MHFFKESEFKQCWWNFMIIIEEIIILILSLLFVCMWFNVPLEKFSLIWRRHHNRWRAAIFNLYSALMAIEQGGGGFFSGCLVSKVFPWHWHPFIIVLSEDSWQSKMLPSAWQWTWHYPFQRLRSAATGIQITNSL